MNRKIPLGLASVLVLAGCAGTEPDLGVENGRLTPCPETPNCVNSQADNGRHAIEPIVFAGVPQAAKERLLQILESEKRADVVQVADNYIRASFRSAIFGFVDDVELYFPEQHDGETIVHVRSASRLGSSDLGVNRKRIERIRDRMSD